MPLFPIFSKQGLRRIKQSTFATIHLANDGNYGRQADKIQYS